MKALLQALSLLSLCSGYVGPPRASRAARASRAPRRAAAGDDLAALSYRDLQARCGGMSASVLSTRLRELQEAGLAEPVQKEGWALTPLGTDLVHALMPLAGWAERWAGSLGTGEV